MTVYATYKLHSVAYLKGVEKFEGVHKFEAGEVVRYSGTPGRFMEPLDAEAWKRWREAEWPLGSAWAGRAPYVVTRSAATTNFPFAPWHPLAVLKAKRAAGETVPSGPWFAD